MLLPRRMSPKVQRVVYPAVCALHGFSYGVLCVPAQMLFLNLPWKSVPAWLLAGVSFDISHGIGNLLAGLLIVPMVGLLVCLNKTVHRV